MNVCVWHTLNITSSSSFLKAGLFFFDQNIENASNWPKQVCCCCRCCCLFVCLFIYMVMVCVCVCECMWDSPIWHSKSGGEIHTNQNGKEMPFCTDTVEQEFLLLYIQGCIANHDNKQPEVCLFVYFIS